MGKYFIGALALLLSVAISACSDKDGAAAGKKANNDVYVTLPTKQSVEIWDDYTAKLEAREKEDLLKEAFAEVKFTSEAAKRSIMGQIAEGVTVKNGKLIGFNDLLADARKNDAEAFVNEEDEKNKNNSAQFTDPMNRGQAEPITGDPNKMDFATYKKWRAQNQ